MCTYEYLLATVNYMQNAVEVESDRILLAPVCMVRLFTLCGTRNVVLMEEVNMLATVTSLFIRVWVYVPFSAISFHSNNPSSYVHLQTFYSIQRLWLWIILWFHILVSYGLRILWGTVLCLVSTGQQETIFPACNQLSQRLSSNSCVRFHAKRLQPVLCSVP